MSLSRNKGRDRQDQNSLNPTSHHVFTTDDLIQAVSHQKYLATQTLVRFLVFADLQLPSDQDFIIQAVATLRSYSLYAYPHEDDKHSFEMTAAMKSLACEIKDLEAKIKTIKYDLAKMKAEQRAAKLTYCALRNIPLGSRPEGSRRALREAYHNGYLRPNREDKQRKKEAALGKLENKMQQTIAKLVEEYHEYHRKIYEESLLQYAQHPVLQYFTDTSLQTSNAVAGPVVPMVASSVQSSVQTASTRSEALTPIEEDPIDSETGLKQSVLQAFNKDIEKRLAADKSRREEIHKAKLVKKAAKITAALIEESVTNRRVLPGHGRSKSLGAVPRGEAQERYFSRIEDNDRWACFELELSQKDAPF
ncbi:hypothetical protein KVT40_004471 [Elsinoe batatas]|uniref:Uncharacterized protein n=1 Tax=Elsinoe batatas TaxID=2601811 RepID=A0A8K0LAC0_9PEZI|nr:hypothetical protein KVT40_004471 [Elsinoe batatas]